MEIKLVQQNIDSYHNKENSAYMEELMTQLLKEKPSILMLTEFCYACQRETIISRLEENGFQIALPEAYTDEDKTNTGMYAACMMAYQGDKFSFTPNPYPRKPILPISCRYIEGTLMYKKSKELEVFLAYAPQTDISIKDQRSYSRKNLDGYLEYSADRLERKAEMLVGASFFMQENKDKLAFLGGDVNTALDGSTTMESIFKTLIYEECFDTDCDKDKPTWKNKRIDYALVSAALKNRCRTTHLKTIGDHTALVSILDIE